MPQLTMRDALNQALHQEMARDDRVLVRLVGARPLQDRPQRLGRGLAQVRIGIAERLISSVLEVPEEEMLETGGQARAHHRRRRVLSDLPHRGRSLFDPGGTGREIRPQFARCGRPRFRRTWLPRGNHERHCC